MDATSLEALYAKPGFMIRRAHQISMALFEEAAAPLGVTTTQYSILHTLRARPDIDQISLCALIGIDRSTCTLVLNLLEQNGLIRRQIHPVDKRRKVLELTQKGHRLLDEIAPATQSVARHMREALSASELDELLRLLGKFISMFNEKMRNPLLAESTAPGSADKKRASKPRRPVPQKAAGSRVAAPKMSKGARKA